MARCLLRFGRALELSKRTGLWIEAITVRGGGRNTQTLHLHGGGLAYRDPRTGAVEIDKSEDTWAANYYRERYLKELRQRKAARSCR